MATRRFTPVRGRMMRITELDGCGRIKPGPCSAIASAGFVSVSATPRQTEPEAITVTNASGGQCVNDEPAPRFLGWDVTISFCEVDPEVFSKVTGQPVEYDHEGNAVGFRTNSDVDPSLKAFALEVWQDIPGDECDEDAQGEGLWSYNLWAFLKGGAISEFTIENGATTFSVNNARTRTGGKWGAGPYDVLPDETGAPGPLTNPWTSADHFLMRLTDVAPPESSDCIASGPEATTATAGTPGVWGPVDAYPPVDFADLTDGDPVVVASPATAWDPGEYVVLGDGSRAHWDGSAWVAGIAP